MLDRYSRRDALSINQQAFNMALNGLNYVVERFVGSITRRKASR